MSQFEESCHAQVSDFSKVWQTESVKAKKGQQSSLGHVHALCTHTHHTYTRTRTIFIRLGVSHLSNALPISMDFHISLKVP